MSLHDVPHDTPHDTPRDTPHDPAPDSRPGSPPAPPPPPDELKAVRRALDELTRTVERLEQRAGRGRPVGPVSVTDPSQMVTVPDTPYDSSLWTDSDDEGLGARDRRAP